MRLVGLDPGKNYICQSFDGRLGNHVWQYASIYGIAALNNLTIILGEDDDLAQYFEVPSAVKVRSRSICESFVKVKTKYCCVFEASVMKLKPNENYKFRNYLQSLKYFEYVQDRVRKELKFKTAINELATETVESFRRQHPNPNGSKTPEPVVVGVHIRRGDLESNPFVRTYTILTPDQYVRNAVDYFLAKFENAIFIVCSDGMEYAKEIMRYRNVTTKFVHGTPVQDLAILSSCDHVIMTWGTFGWWAGFLSRGIVTYHKHPIKEDSFERPKYNYDTFFYPDWIGLE